MLVEDRPGQVGIIGSILGDLGVLIKNIQLTRVEGEDLEIELLIQLPSNLTINDVVNELSEVKGLRNIDRLN
jgi:putative Mg2+ transporter-C (MgtC) family protein